MKTVPRFDIHIKHDRLLCDVSCFLEDDLANLLILLEIDIDDDPIHVGSKTIYVTPIFFVEVQAIDENGNKSNIKDFINK